MEQNSKIEELNQGIRLNYYFMKGNDAIDDKEKVAIFYSEKNTSVHMHDFIEIVYFCHGVGTHYVGGKQYSVFPGCVCVMNNDVKHYYGVEKAYCENIGVKNLIFYPEFLGYSSENFLSEFIQNKLGKGREDKVSFFQVSSNPNREIEQYFMLIEKEMQMKRDNYLPIVRCLTEAILLLLVSNRENHIKGKKFNKSYLRIEESIEFMNLNIKDIPNMKDMAKMYGFSPEYYSKLFREFTGKSYAQFVQEIKCNEAARLLLETDCTNEVISEMCGYSSPKHFYEQFKKCKGVTPKGYIKQNL